MDTTMAMGLIALGILLMFDVFVAVVGAVKNKKNNRKNVGDKPEETLDGKYKKNPNAGVKKEDIFKFMEFDRILDDMIIQNNGEKYTAVIKCKGVNYNLMSEIEQLSVEEGFINFLSTLKFPIQLYVQAQNINLRDNIAKYRENMKGIIQEYDDLNAEYSIVVNSLESSSEEIERAENKRNSALNVVEYGQDIVRYVERLSANKNMLQRNFYVLVSYYKSEITNVTSFDNEEVLDICYSELATRCENIISGLNMCSVTGEMLRSTELAELLYSAYNRDDYNVISVKDAIESGFHRLYSTSKDAIEIKNEKILQTIKDEAQYKAVKALAKAIEDGTVTTPEDIEDNFEEEASRQALDMIKNEDLSEDIKEKAKDIVLEEYRSGKKERIAKKKERIQNFIGIDEEDTTSEGEEKPKKTRSKKQAVEKKQENSANDVSESDGSIV